MRKSESLLAPKQQQHVTPIDQLLVEKVFAGPHVCPNSAGFLHNRFKEPIRIAPQHHSDLLSHLLPGYTNTVDDAAQVRLIDAHQLGQTILAHAGRIHSQLEIGIDTPLLLCRTALSWLLGKPLQNMCVGDHSATDAPPLSLQ